MRDKYQDAPPEAAEPYPTPPATLDEIKEFVGIVLIHSCPAMDGISLGVAREVITTLASYLDKCFELRRKGP